MANPSMFPLPNGVQYLLDFIYLPENENLHYTVNVKNVPVFFPQQQLQLLHGPQLEKNW